MADDIKKLKSSEFIRKIGDSIFSRLPLPRIHPDVVSAISLGLSVAFLFSANAVYQIVILFFVVLADMLDGNIAKRYHYRTTPEDEHRGWMIDVTIDRLSEGFIALAMFIPLFPIFILNTILTIISAKKKMHVILPVRQVLLVYLILKTVLQ